MIRPSRVRAGRVPQALGVRSRCPRCFLCGAWSVAQNDEGAAMAGRGSAEGRVCLRVSETGRRETQGWRREGQKGPYSSRSPAAAGREQGQSWSWGRRLRAGPGLGSCGDALSGGSIRARGPWTPLGLLLQLGGTQHFRGTSAAPPGALAAWRRLQRARGTTIQASLGRDPARSALWLRSTRRDTEV